MQKYEADGCQMESLWVYSQNPHTTLAVAKHNILRTCTYFYIYNVSAAPTPYIHVIDANRVGIARGDACKHYNIWAEHSASGAFVFGPKLFSSASLGATFHIMSLVRARDQQNFCVPLLEGGRGRLR